LKLGIWAVNLKVREWGENGVWYASAEMLECLGKYSMPNY